jgi:probable F420-dependent oxidoreductase
VRAASVGRVQFGISIPQGVHDGTFDPDAQRQYLTRAEELGYDSLWTLEQVLGTDPVVSPLEAMTFAAACTERVRLGCVVFVSPLHHPFHLAKSIASLDQLSRGRFEVGLGVGGRAWELAAFGIAAGSRVARFEEGLEVMKALWTESHVERDGRFWSLHDVGMEPKPFQKPHPPVWIGGHHPNAVRRAVRLADGFVGAGSQTTAQFAAQMEVVRDALDDQGRDPADLRVAKRVYVAVDDDADRAHERMADALQRLYRPEPGLDLTGVAVLGRRDDCIRGLQDVVDLGAELVMLTPLFDHREQMERLAAEVLPDAGWTPQALG